MSALLRETAQRVKEMAISGTLVEKLASQMFFRAGHQPSIAEKRSWENSLIEIANLFVECNLGGINLLIEYQLPYSSKRIDVVAIGSHPKTKNPTIAAIELKQWTSASVFDGVSEEHYTPVIRNV